MRVSTLGLIITIAGIIFVGVSLVIIFLGKKVGDSNESQRIKIGDFETSTNSVLALVIIAALFTLTPLSFSHWYPEYSHYIHKDDVKSDYTSKKNVKSDYKHKDEITANYVKKSKVRNYILTSELKSEFLPLKDSIMGVRGTVLEEREGGTKPAAGVNVEIERKNLDEDETTVHGRPTGIFGSFEVNLPSPKPKEYYTIVLEKDGYKKTKINFGFLSFNTSVVLPKDRQTTD